MSQKVIRILTYALLIGGLVFLLVMIQAWINGKFNSVETFQSYIAGYGVFAPVMLTFFQAAQVVIPALPGFVGCAAGSVMFGAAVGFWCNYIGISLGSVLAFLLARRYGQGLVKKIFPAAKYEKWAEKAASSKSYAAFMFIATLLPLFPDDYLCYLSGLTKMTAKKFIWIIILGKPWCILAYSIGFSFIK